LLRELFFAVIAAAGDFEHPRICSSSVAEFGKGRRNEPRTVDQLAVWKT